TGAARRRPLARPEIDCLGDDCDLPDGGDRGAADVNGGADRRKRRSFSGQVELAVDRAQLGGPNQARVRDRDRVERSLQLFQPEREKAVEHRKSRTQIIVLPDIGLQQRWMVGKPIKNLRSGQTIAFELAAEVPGCHAFVCKALRCHGCPPIRTSSLRVTSHTNKHKKWRKVPKIKALAALELYC